MAYNAAFYLTRRGRTRRTAEALLPYILDAVPARSLLDLGCGLGDWLAAARDMGVGDIHGIDGPWVPRDKLLIDGTCFTEADLSARIPPVEGNHSLAICLEVAEHLPPERAGSFVTELCHLAPVIAFSAAIPGQGGLHHLNEQWPSHWIRLFEGRGFRTFDVLRPRVWEDTRIPYWYRQNLLLFADPRELETCRQLEALRAGGDFMGADLAHPAHAERALQYPGMQDLIRAVPYALARSVAAFGTTAPGAGDGHGDATAPKNGK